VEYRRQRQFEVDAKALVAGAHSGTVRGTVGYALWIGGSQHFSSDVDLVQYTPTYQKSSDLPTPTVSGSSCNHHDKHQHSQLHHDAN
jgi:hypothetical protein